MMRIFSFNKVIRFRMYLFKFRFFKVIVLKLRYRRELGSKKVKIIGELF